MSYDTIAQRFAERAFTAEDESEFLGFNSDRSRVHVHYWPGNYGARTPGGPSWAIYSYGFHFPIAIPISNKHGEFWLFNGARYSPSTTNHQGIVRSALQYGDPKQRPILTIPFPALEAAGLSHRGYSTIRPLDITDDQTVVVPHQTTEYGKAPLHAEHGDDGVYRWNTHEHYLGGAVFEATTRPLGAKRNKTVRYVSGFDNAEPARTRPYFLATLPDRKASTVDEALEALKPPVVVDAETEGRRVVRQGDIFAVPVDLDTRTLKRMEKATYTKSKWDSSDYLHRGVAFLLGTNHAATEVVEVPGEGTFARGTLRHAPNHRNPDHVRQTLGKAWHRILRNTVPLDRNTGEIRAWSFVGGGD